MPDYDFDEFNHENSEISEDREIKGNWKIKL
jgi:hypothetical protein